jgi:uncharacterized protein (TIGR00661 family)
VIGPIIRKEVQEVQPEWGDHLLVYLSNGAHEFIPQLEAALQGVGGPVRVYGAPRTGTDGHIRYQPISSRPFIEDLARCRAVVATTGNQLLGEVTYFQKPILGMPVECLEQRLNALQIERMGIGTTIPRRKIRTEVIEEFLTREHEYRAAFARPAVSAAAEAVAAIEESAQSLMEHRAGRSDTVCALGPGGPGVECDVA